MVSEMNNLRLIDLSKEDDCLLAVSLRDDIEGVRLSGAGCFAVGLDDVNEPELVERKKTSLLHKSLDWDKGFFSSAGLLNTEELHMISKVDKKGKSQQPSCGTRKDMKHDIHKRTKVVINSRGLECGQATMVIKSRKAGTGLSLCNGSQRVNLTSNSTNLTTTKAEKISKIRGSNKSLSSSGSSKCSRRNISPKNTKLTSDPSSVLSPLSSICSSITSPARIFRSARSPSELQSPFRQATRSSIRNIKGAGLRMPSSHVQSESVGSRRLSIIRKSVDWDTAFPSEGLLNPEELFMVTKGFKKAESSQSSTKSQILPHTIASQNQSSMESDRLHLRTLGADLLIDVKPDIKKLTKQANLSKSTSLTTETNSKVQHSNKSSSSGSPKCIRRKFNYKNTKPTTCSSDTSPASSSHGVISPSNFQRPPRHPPCHNTEERKLTSQDATRSSIRNVMPSRLRMPSPRIGFFDEEPPVQLTYKGSMQKPNVFTSVEHRRSFLHKAYGIVPSSLLQVIADVYMTKA